MAKTITITAGERSAEFRLPRPGVCRGLLGLIGATAKVLENGVPDTHKLLISDESIGALLGFCWVGDPWGRPANQAFKGGWSSEWALFGDRVMDAIDEDGWTDDQANELYGSLIEAVARRGNIPLTIKGDVVTTEGDPVEREAAESLDFGGTGAPVPGSSSATPPVESPESHPQDGPPLIRPGTT
jgi:hypothetical protein